ncbi:colanic acid biosynthesis acetyltransferase WcaF [Dyadobacter bucti]|uniref:colanic acid biosynthesis acetyltransferase WcaF n=1 Tax=Dyadobacter bucti TaxID=2572203 RepID=UPI003F7202DC
MIESKPIFNPVQTTPFDLTTKLKAHLWTLVNMTIFKIMPLQFRSYRIYLLRAFGAKLADDVTISRKAVIEHPWNLTMGSLSSLGDGTWAYCLAPITIGRKCCIGKDVFLLTGSHDINDLEFNMVTKPIVIKDCCWVATGAYVLPGVTLRNYTVVAARSVVVKDTDEFAVVGGNPAKFIKSREFKTT